MKFIYISLLAALSLTSCTEYDNRQKTAGPDTFRHGRDHLIMATLYMQRSAEYEAICIQTYRAAAEKLDEKLENGHYEKPAIVLDLDETVLNNSPYAGYQIESGLPYTPESWKRWTDKAEAGLIPGAEVFLNKADSSGVTIFYVSNRRTDELEATLKNMRELKLPQVEPRHFLLRTDATEKKTRRDSIRKQGNEVLMYIGDQLSDFHEVWDAGTNEERKNAVREARDKFGSEYFILPNPVYGTWERAVYNYAYGLSPREKDALRREVIEKTKLEEK